jgi:hypothetical protein
MPIPRIGGPGVPLDLAANASWWSRTVNGGAGYGFNQIVLTAGASFALPPGVFHVQLDASTVLEIRDPVQGVFRPLTGVSFIGMIQSDGGNFRITNITGQITSTTITAAGSGYTAPPTITPSGGGATFQGIIGGAVASAVGAGGSNYSYVPQLVFAAPPPGGIQATGHVTLTSQAIATVVMDNAGAGYAAPPVALIVRDPRDTTGSGGVITTSLTGAGTLTGILIVDGGTTVATPTLALTGNATATAAQLVATAANATVLIQPE